jgi:hypothetical protein
MQTSSFDGRQLRKAVSLATTTLSRVHRMLPNLKSTCLEQITDFYTLAVLIGKYQQERPILTDRRRDRLAWDLLKTFANRVDEVRELQRKARGARPDQELYREYLITVSQMTDDVSQRRKREQILGSISKSLCSSNDSQSGFTAEQRRIIWNTSANRVCSHSWCAAKLTWDDFIIDHIDPHAGWTESIGECCSDV